MKIDETVGMYYVYFGVFIGVLAFLLLYIVEWKEWKTHSVGFIVWKHIYNLWALPLLIFTGMFLWPLYVIVSIMELNQRIEKKEGVLDVVSPHRIASREPKCDYCGSFKKAVGNCVNCGAP